MRRKRLKGFIKAAAAAKGAPPKGGAVMLRYDLHCHSCASPCGDNSMTPATLCGLAKLAGIQLLAVTDHNCAGSRAYMALARELIGRLPATRKAA